MRGHSDAPDSRFDPCADRVNRAARLATPPFSGPSAAINVYRLDVASAQSGADDPAPCGAGATADTFFDATFCGNGVDRRLLFVDDTSTLNTVYAELPWSHVILVIVNSTIHGGTRRGVITTSSSASRSAPCARSGSTPSSSRSTPEGL
ncbi:hypothetical protein DEJ45_02210 [Streptomyces venezuelae]|nr:hypothetical protein DEJ45_02210 [Streptomyces venezuelae]